jgi:hypothetical protein
LFGLTTIRAFQSQNQFFDRFIAAQNNHSRAYFSYLGTLTWRELYIDVCVWMFAVTAVFLCIAAKDTLEVG